jgi:23S rRNA (adenine2503-C2)-methyltransferase
LKIEKVIKDQLNRLFEITTDDNYTIESVYYRGDTLCVSSEIGCPVKCTFCASGMKGLVRNLSFQEIINQYLLVKKEGYKITNIAFAGIGEPLLNFEAVKKAFEFFKEEGLRVSFYTTGFPIDKFEELLKLQHNGITLSLHSVFEEKRKDLIPYGHTIKQLLDIFETHLKDLSNRQRKKYSIGYLLISGENNSEEELSKLAEIANNLKIGISLLKFNEISGIPFKTTTDEEYEKAFLYLREKGIRVTLSNSYRTRKIGGCGTLMINRFESVGK